MSKTSATFFCLLERLVGQGCIEWNDSHRQLGGNSLKNPVLRQVRWTGPMIKCPGSQRYSIVEPTAKLCATIVELGGCSGLPQPSGSEDTDYHSFVKFFDTITTVRNSCDGHDHLFIQIKDDYINQRMKKRNKRIWVNWVVLTVLADKIEFGFAVRVSPEPPEGAVKTGAVFVAPGQVPKRHSHIRSVDPFPICPVHRVPRCPQPILCPRVNPIHDHKKSISNLKSHTHSAYEGRPLTLLVLLTNFSSY